jgi:hypothetical protein
LETKRQALTEAERIQHAEWQMLRYNKSFGNPNKEGQLCPNCNNRGFIMVYNADIQDAVARRCNCNPKIKWGSK